MLGQKTIHTATSEDNLNYNFECEDWQIKSPKGSLECNLYKDYFNEAYQQYPNIPRGILEAVADNGVTGFVHTDDGWYSGEWDPTHEPPRTYTVMNYQPLDFPTYQNNLSLVAQISGYSEKQILENPRTSIFAYASALSKMMEKSTVGSNDWESIIDIIVELGQFDGSNEFITDMVKYRIISYLNSSEKSENFNFPKRNIKAERIIDSPTINILQSEKVNIDKQNNKIFNENGDSILLKNNPVNCNDFPFSDFEYETPTCNYGSRTKSINRVAIHTIENSFESGMNTFMNCTSSVSAHYIVGPYPLASSESMVAQGVCEEDKAQHIGFHNSNSIGIEHAGIAHQTIFSVDFYEKAALLVKDIMNSYDVLNTKNIYSGKSQAATTLIKDCIQVKGHQHFDLSMNTAYYKSDPGDTWDWFYFYGLVNEDNTIQIPETSPVGDFFDSGGNSGNYQPLENRIYTIQRNPGEEVELNISEFNLGDGDYMWIYDTPNPNIEPNPHNNITDNGIGPNQPSLLPVLTFATGSITDLPQTTFTSTNGGFTIFFRSDCSGQASGFRMSWESSSDNCPNDQYEPINDSPVQAQNIFPECGSSNVNETFDSYICVPTDVDWYSFNTAAPGKIKIKLNDVPNGKNYLLPIRQGFLIG